MKNKVQKTDEICHVLKSHTPYKVDTTGRLNPRMKQDKDLALVRLGIYRTYLDDLLAGGFDDQQVLYCVQMHVRELERQHEQKPITRDWLAELQGLQAYSTVVLAALELDLPEIIGGITTWPNKDAVAEHVDLLLSVIREIVNETLTTIKEAERSYPLDIRMHWAQQRIDLEKEIAHYATNKRNPN